MGKGAGEDASGAGAGSSGAASREARAATMLEGRGVRRWRGRRRGRRGEAVDGDEHGRRAP